MNFTLTVNKYKQAATYITQQERQDSYYAAQLEGQFVPAMHRAIAKAMEVDTLALINGGQTASNLNTINGGDHRFVASGTSSVIVPKDFARARYALKQANVPSMNLVGIVDNSVEYQLSTLTNLVNVSFNPRWEGIVRDGMSTGMKFFMNVFGFDIYTTMNLPGSITETVNSVTVTSDGVANQFFSAAAGVTPFVGTVRQAPQVWSDFNKDLQREEYVTTTRYGLKLFRPENAVTILSAATQIN